MVERHALDIDWQPLPPRTAPPNLRLLDRSGRVHYPTPDMTTNTKDNLHPLQKVCARSAPSKRDLLKLSRYGELLRLAAGDFLWKEGDRADTIVLVLAGELISNRANDFGQDLLILGLYPKGTVIGVAEVIGERNRPCSVHARKDANLLILKRHDLEKMAVEEPDLAKRLERMLWHSTAHQIDSLMGRIAALS